MGNLRTIYNVRLVYADGTVDIEPFPTRLLAEMYMQLIPVHQMMGIAEYMDIRSAKIQPQELVWDWP